MIGRLAGTLVERVPPRVIVDCNGVGYEVVCSGNTLAGLPADGEKVVLRVFTHATENRVALFGFGDAHERTLFDLLITVKNVGPSTAIAILSGSSPRDIATLIAREDVPGLTRIKGIGKKTAELLVVELHDKCEEMMIGWDASIALAPKIRVKRNPLVDDVALALVGMGWKPAEVDQVLGEMPVPTDATIDSLLKQALRSMPR